MPCPIEVLRSRVYCICLSVCLSICLSVCLSICLSVCLSLFREMTVGVGALEINDLGDRGREEKGASLCAITAASCRQHGGRLRFAESKRAAGFDKQAATPHRRLVPPRCHPTQPPLTPQPPLNTTAAATTTTFLPPSPPPPRPRSEVSREPTVAKFSDNEMAPRRRPI